MTRPSDNQLASLIVRDYLALSEEGASASGGDQPFDGEVLRWAVATNRSDPARTVTDQNLYDLGLLTEDEHPPCKDCAYRIGHMVTVVSEQLVTACTAVCSCGWKDPAGPLDWLESLEHGEQHVAEAIAAWGGA